MKYSLILVAAVFVMLSCNDNTAGTADESNMDTTAKSQSDSPASPVPAAGHSANELMNAMTSMMQDIKSMQASGNPDHDFAMMMSRHHKAAIEMTNAELTEGLDSTLKQLARKIADESQKEIAELDSSMSSHTGNKKSDYAQKVVAIMDRSMSSHSMTGNVDEDFASMMVQHHKDGIEMAKEYLKTGTEAKLKKIANGIIANQPRDIQKLENWQKTHK
jgi:uncharacterized protein (DUF305 family)